MKCPACGYLSFTRLPRCTQCGVAFEPQGDRPPEEAGEARSAGESLERRSVLTQRAAMPGARPALDRAAIEEVTGLIEITEGASPLRKPGCQEEADPDFPIPDEIIPPFPSGREEEATAASPEQQSAGPTEVFRSAARDPIIDRAEEVPERFWLPEGAGMSCRVAALLFDLACLALIMVLFYGAACLSLLLSGFDPSGLLSARGVFAALPPLSLLALLLSQAYFTFFHGWIGRTPGKGLAGIEVRTLNGSGLSYGTALVRSLAALLGFLCAGVGLAWAFFEPRRRGWADLASGTVLGERLDRRG